jgi:hypothetical protein
LSANIKPTEVVRQNRVSNGDVTGNAFIEATISKYSKGRSEMLLAVQPLVFWIIELWILSDAQQFARYGAAAHLDLFDRGLAARNGIRHRLRGNLRCARSCFDD